MSPSVQVLLLSSPGLEELYRCCMLFVDDMAEPRETPEHPLKQMKVRAGCSTPGTSLVVSGACWVFSGLVPTHKCVGLLCRSQVLVCVDGEGAPGVVIAASCGPWF